MALPDHVPPPVRAAVAEAHRRLRALYGERLDRVVLYGSHARGDAHDESDVDLLVVLRGDYEPWVELKRTGRVRHDLLVQYGRDVSIQPFSVEEAADESRPLMFNAAREGVRL